jgi:hypothetical protein
MAPIPADFPISGCRYDAADQKFSAFLKNSQDCGFCGEIPHGRPDFLVVRDLSSVS